MEKLADCSVALLSTSPQREDTIPMTDPFRDQAPGAVDPDGPSIFERLAHESFADCATKLPRPSRLAVRGMSIKQT